MKINTPNQFKKAMKPAKTIADLYEILENTHTSVVTKLVDVYSEMEKYTDITMQDEYVLSTARIELQKRK